MANSKYSYKHSLKHYVEVYKVSYSTIQKYAREAYPLDNYEATLLRIGSQKYQKAPVATDNVEQENGQNEQDAISSVLEASVEPSVEPLGLKASINRLQRAERAAAAKYERTIDPVKQQALQKNWLALVEQLRKVEQSTPDIEESNKQAVSLSDLKTVLNELFLRLRQDLDTLPKRIALELTGQDELNIREILKREIEEIIVNLFNCKFLLNDSK